jgi:hypothetical protein
LIEIGGYIEEPAGFAQALLRFAQARLGVVQENHLIVACVQVGEPSKTRAYFDEPSTMGW